MTTLHVWATRGDDPDGPQSAMHVTVIMRGRRLSATTVWARDWQWEDGTALEVLDMLGQAN